MIVRAAGLLVPVALGACSGDPEKTAENTAAAANYVPPSVTSRADYGGMVERRFHRLDANADDRLALAEVPGRNARLLDRYDKDGNKTLDSSEWGAAMLERFDRLDTNKDGTVTSEERETVRRARAGGETAAAGNTM